MRVTKLSPFLPNPADNASLICNNGEIRLIGGNGPYEGQVEVCFNGQWGTVCQDRWDSTDAQTVCQILGYEGQGLAIQTTTNFFDVDPDGPVLIDEVRCTGNETNFLDCLSVSVGVHDCSHALDAGVFCNGVSYHHTTHIQHSAHMHTQFFPAPFLLMFA